MICGVTAGTLLLLLAGPGPVLNRTTPDPAPRDGSVALVDKPYRGPRLLVNTYADLFPQAVLAAGPKPSAPPPAEAVPVIGPPTPALRRSAVDLSTFRGLSTWVDLHDTALRPEDQVAIARDQGVDAVYVQSARYSSPTDIHDYYRLAALIESAHDAGIEVMVWYIPDFVDPARDLRRAKAAMAFLTPRGDRPDAFGLDIEADDVADVGLRTQRLLRLSRGLRDWVGPHYPMAAIVLPPLQLELNTRWWPGFPYAELAELYDVMIPMSYSSFRGVDPDTTYGWNLGNVERTRALAGRADLPVHLAGGIADDLPEVAAFVSAAADGAVVGGGLYDLHTRPPEAWPALEPLSRRGRPLTG